MSNILPRSVARFADAQSWLESYNNGLLLIHLPDDSLERECGLISFEKGFNLAGYAPAISNISAVVRAWLGVVVVVEGVARLAFNGLAFTYYSCRDAYRRYQSQSPKKHYIPSFSILNSKRKALNSLNLFSHGMANLGRAGVEFIPFFGNFACWLYDDCGLRLRYNITDVTRTLKNAQKKGATFVRSKSQYHLASMLYGTTTAERETPTLLSTE